MIVRAFLMRTGSVKVMRPETPRAEMDDLHQNAAGYEDFDSGIVEHWPSIVRFAETKVWDSLTLVGRTAHRLETHYRCKQRVYESNRTTYNPDGEIHDCPKSTNTRRKRR